MTKTRKRDLQRQYSSFPLFRRQGNESQSDLVFSCVPDRLVHLNPLDENPKGTLRTRAVVSTPTFRLTDISCGRIGKRPLKP